MLSSSKGLYSDGLTNRRDPYEYRACRRLYAARGILVPGVFIRMLKTEVRAVKNIVRLSGPPQAQLAGISGKRIMPK